MKNAPKKGSEETERKKKKEKGVFFALYFPFLREGKQRTGKKKGRLEQPVFLGCLQPHASSSEKTVFLH